MNQRRSSDVLVLGSGAAGLATALQLAESIHVQILSKDQIHGGSTNRAQGGVAAVLHPHDSIESHVADTIKAGDGLCDPAIVRFTVENAAMVIDSLLQLGVEFDKYDNGLHLTQEGGHSFRRVLHAADATGQAIASKLVQEALNHPQIDFISDRIVIDVITAKKLGLEPNRAYGAYAYNSKTDEVEVYESRYVVLATGGASKVYVYTTNPDGSTGDGIAMAWRAGCRVANMEFNQFHPTCLFHPNARSFLISEAVRGEGGHLILDNGERFMHRFDERQELASRDIVARAIDFEMKRLGSDCVYVDVTHLSERVINKHFPTIFAKCLELGIDIRRQPIPVVPAAHYTCGGVLTDRYGRTDVPGLYAVGETAYTGLHGANRLASNSLLECFVFAHSAAEHIAKSLQDTQQQTPNIPSWDASQVTDSDENIVLTHNWTELRRFMWNYVGIVRTNKRLERAVRRIELLKQEVHEHYSNYRVNSDLIELRNLIQVADLMIQAACWRRESRGLHYTLDYPKQYPRALPSILTPDSHSIDALSAKHTPSKSK